MNNTYQRPIKELSEQLKVLVRLKVTATVMRRFTIFLTIAFLTMVPVLCFMNKPRSVSALVLVFAAYVCSRWLAKAVYLYW